MNVKVITTCTKSKQAVTQLHIPASMDLFDNQDQLANYWQEERHKIPEADKIPAANLYNGRSFQRALMSVKDASDLYVVSTGLGLVNGTDLIPGYELTISTAAANRVSKRIAFGGFDAEDWWTTVNETETPIADVIAANKDSIFVIAISKEYLLMIASDLASIDPVDRERVFIAGYNLDASLPIELFDQYLPYDVRLNKNSKYSGSKLDFSARVCYHFVNEILPQTQDQTEAVKLVVKAMENYGDLESVNSNGRSKMTDQEIISQLETIWDRYQGRKVMLLRILREKMMVSCSQKRFDMIYESMAKNKAA